MKKNPRVLSMTLTLACMFQAGCNECCVLVNSCFSGFRGEMDLSAQYTRILNRDLKLKEAMDIWDASKYSRGEVYFYRYKMQWSSSPYPNKDWLVAILPIGSVIRFDKVRRPAGGSDGHIATGVAFIDGKQIKFEYTLGWDESGDRPFPWE